MLVLRSSARRTVPVGRCKIDPFHPLAQGLVGCWLPGLSGVDLAGVCPTLTLKQLSPAPSPYLRMGEEGPALVGTEGASGGNLLRVLSPPAFKGWSQFSLYYRGPRGVGDANNGFTAPFLLVTYTNGVNSPYTVVGIGDLSGGQLKTCCTGWNDGSSEHKGTGVDLHSKKLLSVAGTFVVGGSVILYSDGVQAASDSWGTASLATSSSDTININGWDTPDTVVQRYSPSLCNIACAWNRALSPAEVALLDADPYGFLIPDEGQWPALYVAGSPPPVGRGSRLALLGVA